MESGEQVHRRVNHSPVLISRERRERYTSFQSGTTPLSKEFYLEGLYQGFSRSQSVSTLPENGIRRLLAT